MWMFKTDWLFHCISPFVSVFLPLSKEKKNVLNNFRQTKLPNYQKSRPMSVSQLHKHNSLA